MKKLNLIVAILAISTQPLFAAAHEREHFSAGEPGDPKQPARVVKVLDA